MLCLLLSNSLFSVFPSSPCFSCLPRHRPYSAALSSKRKTFPLARGTCSHLKTLWKTGSFLVRPHTIHQETCHLTKGHKPQNTKKTQGKKPAPHLNGLLCYHKTGKLAGNLDRFQKLRLHSRSREACLPAGIPSGIFAVKTQDEPNWWHLFLACKPSVRVGKRGIINKTQVSALLLLQKGSRQSVDICPPPRYSKRSHADPKKLTCWLAIVWYHQKSLVVM